MALYSMLDVLEVQLQPATCNLQVHWMQHKLEWESGVLRGLVIPGHPAELSHSVKLLLTDAKSHVFDINLVLKSIH